MNDWRRYLTDWIRGLRALAPYFVSRQPKYRRFTEEYPDEISSRMSTDLSPRSKGFLKNDLNTCTGCEDCLRLCPARALEIDSEVKVDGSIRVRRFSIDLGRCVACSICVEVCPVGSITHSRDYEVTAYSPKDLRLEFFDRTKPLNGQQEVREKIRLIRAYEVRR